MLANAHKYRILRDDRIDSPVGVRDTLARTHNIVLQSVRSLLSHLTTSGAAVSLTRCFNTPCPSCPWQDKEVLTTRGRHHHLVSHTEREYASGSQT